MTAPSGTGGNARGILAMVAACFLFIVNDVLIKQASGALPLGEIVSLRGLISFLIVAAILAGQGRLRTLAGGLKPRVAIRSFADLGSSATYIPALFHMPIGNAQAIVQSMPLALTGAAALFFGEKVGWRRWTAIGIGFLGVLIIVRPGMAGFNVYALGALGAVLMNTFRDLVTRTIPSTVSGLVITAGAALVAAFGGLGFMLALGESWSMPGGVALLFVAGAAAVLNVGYLCLILAMRIAEVAVVAPFRYALVIFAILSGYLVWGEIPDLTTLAGTGIVIATGLYTLHRERLRHRDLVAASEPPT
jgi:drug/metabolite transporter (DMT)-like permease